jgi:hypothetical protein
MPPSFDADRVASTVALDVVYAPLHCLSEKPLGVTRPD